MLVAAVVTGVALVVGLGSGGKIVKARTVSAAVALPSGSQSFTSRLSVLRKALARQQHEAVLEMRVAGRLIAGECGIGAGGDRTATAPRARRTLLVTDAGLPVRLYLVGSHEVICSQHAIAGDAVTGPAQRPARPAPAAIALAGVSQGEKNGHRATVEYGRAGAEVRRLSFVLSGGRRVAGVVGGGWFLVAWPSGRSPTAARLTTTSGLVTVPLGAAAASPSVSCRHHQACFASSAPGHVISSSKYFSVGSSSVSIGTAGAGHG